MAMPVVEDMDLFGLSLSLLPLVVIFLGIVLFKKSGSLVVIIALALTALLSWGYFKTDPIVVYGGIAYGILSSLGIALAVVFAMFMVFLMQVTGALKRISDAIHNITGTLEEKALFVGMGFGSFVTALGLLTTTLFPPLLMAMGFSPVAAVAIACLGYDPLCSFALLSLPVTLPAETATKSFGIPVDPQVFAQNIAIFLPIISVGFAFAILWVIGRIPAIKRSWVPALMSGLVISLSALAIVYFNLLPLQLVGVVAGALSMLSLYLYSKAKAHLNPSLKTKPATATDGGSTQKISLLRALSPWIILIVLVSIVGIPQVEKILTPMLGQLQVIPVFANVTVNLKVMSQVYTWILIASIISIFTLGATKKQIKEAIGLMFKRAGGPFISFPLFFAIGYLMFYSGGMIVNGAFVPGPIANPAYNMDAIIGIALAGIFGAYYGFVAPIPGFIGTVIGGNETASNIMFAKIQNVAVTNTIGADKFDLVYGSHAVAGGISSAITPAKVNNACATLGLTGPMESKVIKMNGLVAILMTLVTCVLTFIFLTIGL